MQETQDSKKGGVEREYENQREENNKEMIE